MKSKQVRREEAAERQRIHDGLTLEERMLHTARRRGNSKRERARLTALREKRDADAAKAADAERIRVAKARRKETR